MFSYHFCRIDQPEIYTVPKKKKKKKKKNRVTITLSHFLLSFLGIRSGGYKPSALKVKRGREREREREWWPLLVLGVGLWLKLTVSWRWSSQQPATASSSSSSSSSIPYDQYVAQAASHDYVKIQQRLPWSSPTKTMTRLLRSWRGLPTYDTTT